LRKESVSVAEGDCDAIGGLKLAAVLLGDLLPQERPELVQLKASNEKLLEHVWNSGSELESLKVANNNLLFRTTENYKGWLSC
jgi:hypothetical protein